MNDRQVWQTIALDLKRAANLLHAKRKKQAEYFLDEARQMYETRKEEERERITKNLICFSGDPEDILLGSSIILGRL